MMEKIGRELIKKGKYQNTELGRKIFMSKKGEKIFNL